MEDYATLRRPAAGSPKLRSPGRDRAEPELQAILNQRPAVQRQAELGEALARRPAARPVVQRMTVEEYETATLGGSTVEELLDEGYENYVAREQEAQREPLDEAVWKETQRQEITAYLASIDLEKFRTDEKAKKAVQIAVGGLGKGKPLLLPPDPASLADTDLLFRGTTLDTSTGELYVGSGGSAHGSPTTPSATIAALFATKSATEHQVPGRIVFGTVGAVKGRGFAPPDTMSAQEQEITVAAPPQETNALLGGNIAVEDFRRALKLIGIVIPSSLTPGQDFDDRLERAARNPLTPGKQERLRALLTGNPQENIANWEGLQASVNDVEQDLAGQKGRLERIKGADTREAKTILDEVRTRLEEARNAATLEEGREARDAAAADLERLKQAITVLQQAQAAQSSKDAEEDEDFDLFAE